MRKYTTRPFIAAIFTLMLGAPSLSGCATPQYDNQKQAENSNRINISKQENTLAAEHARLFYKTMLGELEYVSSNFNDAYFMILNAAKQSHDGALYERAIQIAIRASADDSALKAAREWENDKPNSKDAYRYTLDILLKLKQYNKIEPSVRKIIQLTPNDERPLFIIGMGQYLTAHAQDIAPHYESILAPWLNGANVDEAIAARISLSLMKLAINQPEEAFAEIQKAHQMKPDSSEPIMAAINLLEHKDTPQVQKLIRTYLEKPAAKSEVRLLYTQYLLRKQKIAEAKKQLEFSTRSPETPAVAWFILGSLQLDDKELKPGIENLSIYLEKTKTDTSSETKSNQERAYLELAQAEADLGNLENTQKWINKITDPEIRNPAQKTYIGILARAGKYELALDALKKLPSKNEEEEADKVLLESGILIQQNKLEQAYSLLDKVNNKTARQNEDLLYQQAVVADKMNDYPKMESLLREIIQLNPDHVDAYNALGYSLADRNQRLDEAHELISKATKLKPDNPMIQDSLGWVEFRRGNSDKALDLLEKAYAKFPDSEVAAHLGEVQWSLHLKDEALTTFKIALLNDPDSKVLKKTIERLQISQKSLNDFAVPAHILDKMRTTPPANAGAYISHLIQTGQWQQIYDLLGPIIEKTPEPSLLQLQAYAADKTGRLEEAEALLRKIIEMSPDDAMAYNDLGYILANRNIRLQEAKELIEKAYRMNPESAAITDSMGWVEFRLGNLEKAIEYLQKAYKMDPENTENAIHLGEALWASERQGEAILVWKEIQEKHPESAELKETLERLGAKLP